MKRLLLISFVLATSIPCIGQNIKVFAAGALKNFMKDGEISAKASLDTLADKPNLYALGALENLRGEILIIDSKPYISSVENGAIHINQSFQNRASLLVYSQVASWREVEIPLMVKTYTQLEAFITSQITYLELDMDSVFPFRMSGKASSADWHVIDWPEGDQQHTHEKHKSAGLNGRLNQQHIEVLGFYSTHHHGIFTHHTTNMHLHMINDDQNITGHVDDLVLNGKMKLYLPNPKNKF